MFKSAIISEDGRYRYCLRRQWSTNGAVLFVMLNPSTADAEVDDPTIRKCMGFARRWGLGGIYIGNLFAFRARKPMDMRRAADPIGPDNMYHLDDMARIAAESGAPVVCAWGAGGTYRCRDNSFLALLKVAHITPLCLRITRGRMPEHPLYVPYDLQPVEYPGR